MIVISDRQICLEDVEHCCIMLHFDASGVMIVILVYPQFSSILNFSDFPWDFPCQTIHNHPAYPGGSSHFSPCHPCHWSSFASSFKTWPGLDPMGSWWKLMEKSMGIFPIFQMDPDGIFNHLKVIMKWFFRILKVSSCELVELRGVHHAPYGQGCGSTPILRMSSWLIEASRNNMEKNNVKLSNTPKALAYIKFEQCDQPSQPLQFAPGSWQRPSPCPQNHSSERPRRRLQSRCAQFNALQQLPRHSTRSRFHSRNSSLPPKGYLSRMGNGEIATLTLQDQVPKALNI